VNLSHVKENQVKHTVAHLGGERN